MYFLSGLKQGKIEYLSTVHKRKNEKKLLSSRKVFLIDEFPTIFRAIQSSFTPSPFEGFLLFILIKHVKFLFDLIFEC